METVTDFNKLEMAVLEWIGKEYNDPDLNEQIKSAKFVKRDMTKVGFMFTLKFPEIWLLLIQTLSNPFQLETLL